MLAMLARVAAEAGDLDWAEAAARGITDPGWRALALSGLRRAAAASDPQRAEVLAGQAEAIARAVTDPGWRAEVLGGLARVAAEAGDPERARALAGQAEAAARAINWPGRRAQALAALVRAAADAGDPDRARALAGAITDQGWRAQALTRLARRRLTRRGLGYWLSRPKRLSGRSQTRCGGRSCWASWRARRRTREIQIVPRR